MFFSAVCTARFKTIGSTLSPRLFFQRRSADPRVFALSFTDGRADRDALRLREKRRTDFNEAVCLFKTARQNTLRGVCRLFRVLRSISAARHGTFCGYGVFRHRSLCFRFSALFSAFRFYLRKRRKSDRQKRGSLHADLSFFVSRSDLYGYGRNRFYRIIPFIRHVGKGEFQGLLPFVRAFFGRGGDIAFAVRLPLRKRRRKKNRGGICGRRRIRNALSRRILRRIRRARPERNVRVRQNRAILFRAGRGGARRSAAGVCDYDRFALRLRAAVTTFRNLPLFGVRSERKKTNDLFHMH